MANLRTRGLLIAAAALAGAATTACGADGSSAPVGDPSDAYRAIAEMRAGSSLDALEPRRLVDALPNREIVVRTDAGDVAKGRFSDVVAAGRIVSVTPHEGIAYPDADPTAPGDEEAGVEVLAFDDPKAAARVALVALDVDWSAGEEVGRTLEFRLAVPAGIDPDRFLAGIRGIQDAVVLLDRDEAGRNKGAYRPILNAAGLGSVGVNGALSFDGVGAKELEFTAGMDTIEALRTAATRPPTTVQY